LQFRSLSIGENTIGLSKHLNLQAVEEIRFKFNTSQPIESGEEGGPKVFVDKSSFYHLPMLRALTLINGDNLLAARALACFRSDRGVETLKVIERFAYHRNRLPELQSRNVKQAVLADAEFSSISDRLLAVRTFSTSIYQLGANVTTSLLPHFTNIETLIIKIPGSDFHQKGLPLRFSHSMPEILEWVLLAISPEVARFSENPSSPGSVILPKLHSMIFECFECVDSDPIDMLLGLKDELKDEDLEELTTGRSSLGADPLASLTLKLYAVHCAPYRETLIHDSGLVFEIEVVVDQRWPEDTPYMEMGDWTPRE